MAAETDIVTPVPQRRRTQAERRATTRRALLDATLEELDAVGYANLTTASVVARAGVTRGAQAHYFATKADLVVQALRHITDQLIAELIAQPPKRSLQTTSGRVTAHAGSSTRANFPARSPTPPPHSSPDAR